MEFIKNHFYKLTKEIPVRQLFQIPKVPSGYNDVNDLAYYSYLYRNSNIYGSYTISTYDSNGNMIISQVNPYEACKRFTIDNIYHAASSISLYDDTGIQFTLYKEEIECFEEVDIGLSEISKKFMEKQSNSGKMAFHFRFYSNMVIFNISLNGKYHTSVSLMGVMGQVNEMLHNAYIALRKSYINKVKNNIETSYKWSTIMGGSQYIYDIETNGVLGRL